MIVSFSVHRGAAPRAEPWARRAIRLALATAPSLPAGELNVIWTARDPLRKMNRRFRQVNRYTDVIAFRHGPVSAAGRFPLKSAEPAPFGDLYIAVDQARANARRFGATIDEELVRLSVHGTLHLLGHTDYAPGPRARMWAVQEPIVQSIVKRMAKERGLVR
ncbi:MAG: rRNA maturation RNase YbeY [Elusimicrobia bacterium]|nr:rRNA maturation RNase YbeY [Elusimicrobiota bacterium]